MNPGQQDYKQLLTQVIKKQIIILGPDITLAKARNVPGLVVADDGTVTEISGDSQQLTQKLIDQFVQLSGEIVKKTMEPLLSMNTTATPTTGLAPVIPPAVTAPTPQITPLPQQQYATSQPQQQVGQPLADVTPIAQPPIAQDTKPVQ